MIADITAVVIALALTLLFGWLARRAWVSECRVVKWPTVMVSGLFTFIFAFVFVVAAIVVYQLYGPASTLEAQISTVWLCRPGIANNPCEADLTTTTVRSDGTTNVQSATPAKDPPIDCFYVYPAVSQQLAVNADLSIDPEEAEAAILQASRFSQVCKVYAPMYREITGLGEMIPGTYSPQSRAAATAEQSLVSAWNDYLARYNQGRGFVLIGHSEGASVLIDLIKSQIDSNPVVRGRLVSALILGGNVLVPVEKELGGTFVNIPVCRTAQQTGCVVAYSMFDSTPPANAYFGFVKPNQLVPWQSVSESQAAGLEVLCTNPASLAGGPGMLQPYFPTVLAGGDIYRPIIAPAPSPPTLWVNYPDLYRAQCISRNGATWLQVDDVAGLTDHRSIVHTTTPQTGLHIYDLNLALGNLVFLVGEEATAYAH